jgi:ATP-dependent Clp protease ATP-binding subunit ClpC
LQGSRILLVDPATLLSEAIFANQLEHKVAALSRNLLKGKAVLFFDEIESFIGSGASSTDEEGDVLNLLLPFLKRSNGLRLLGSTTSAGWKRLAQLRPAVSRRCVPIPVDPLSDDEVQQVLRGHAQFIAQRTGWVVEPAALSTALDLASALRPEAQPPGGACELLQLALAHRRAAFAQDRSAARITAESLLDSVQATTGLQRFLLTPGTALRRETIRAFLAERILGQPQVVAPLADRVQLIQHRLCAPGRPLATYLFTGPSGVGKTHAALTLAELLHGDRRAVSRFDMSEYGQPQDSASRFIGSRQRYQQTRPGLVDVALARPFPVILLDEIEKAHHSVFDVLLQVLGEARLTDGGGRTARFDTALFLITSNLGVNDRAIGFTGLANEQTADGGVVPRAVRDFLRPEFVNRLTAVIPFQPLSPAAIQEVARREVAALAMRPGLRRRSLAIEVTDAALERLVATGYSSEFGARPMLRVVERDIGGAIARHLEQHPEASDRAVLVHLDPDSGTFTTTPQRANRTTDRTCTRAAARPRPTLTLARTRASN